MEKQQLIDFVINRIYQNNDGEITGDILQQTMVDMIETLYPPFTPRFQFQIKVDDIGGYAIASPSCEAIFSMRPVGSNVTIPTVNEVCDFDGGFLFLYTGLNQISEKKPTLIPPLELFKVNVDLNMLVSPMKYICQLVITQKDPEYIHIASPYFDIETDGIYPKDYNISTPIKIQHNSFFKVKLIVKKIKP